jgi:hypothetical protein
MTIWENSPERDVSWVKAGFVIIFTNASVLRYHPPIEFASRFSGGDGWI